MDLVLRGGLTPCNQPRTLSLQNNQVDIEGSGASAGSEEKLELQNGAIRHAPQFPPWQSTTPAGAGTAQPSADNVSEILTIIKSLDSRLMGLEQKVDRLLAQGTTLQQVRNEVLTIKTNVATIEGMMSTIKIMDPGVPTGVSINDVKSRYQDCVTIVAGPDPPPMPQGDPPAIHLDHLARPVASDSLPTRHQTTSGADMSSIKLTLVKMAEECISDPSKRESMIAEINTIASPNDAASLKRKIISSVI